MAEKEERILCIETDEKIVECGYGDFYNTVPRKEAINRMAKAIRKKLFKNEGPTQKIKEQGLEKEYYEYVDFCCTSIAEAALNALLEEK